MAGEQRALAGAGGTVTIGDRVIYVEPLPFRQEVAFVDELRKLAKEHAGDYVKTIEPVLDRLAKLKTPEANARAAAILETAARMEVRQELPGDDAAEAMRRTPKGVALELWYRSRRMHPAVDLRELQAVILADEDARDLHWQIREALGGGGPDDPKAAATDPVALTLGLLTHDLYQVWERQYEPRERGGSRGVPLAEFYELTAYQLFRHFFRPRRDPAKPDWDRDPVALVRFANEARVRAGLSVELPPHILKGLPRA